MEDDDFTVHLPDIKPPKDRKGIKPPEAFVNDGPPKMSNRMSRMSARLQEGREAGDGLVSSLVTKARRVSQVALDVVAEIAEDHDFQVEEEKARMKRGEIAMLEGGGSGKAAAMMKATKHIKPEELSCFRHCLYKLITWPGFDTAMGLVIVANGVTIGIESHYKNTLIPLGCDDKCNCDPKGAVCFVLPFWVDLLDIVFLGLYTIEFSLRFAVLGFRVLGSNWIKFDLFLVVMGFADLILKTVNLENDILKNIMLVRMLRLARLARMVRLMIQFQTLWTLVQGLMYSVNTLLWTFVMMATIMYMFTIAGIELLEYDLSFLPDHPYNVAVKENFLDLWDAFFLMLQFTSFDSIASVYRPIVHQTGESFVFIMAIILFLSVSLMNLVTAIMVEGSIALAAEDKEVRQMVAKVRKQRQMLQLKEMFKELDEDGSGEVSLEEILSAPEDVIENVTEIAGSDDLRGLFEMLDYDGGGTLEVDEFCDGVFKFANQTKPMELDRLIKQCSDILKRQREAVAILRGKDISEVGPSQDGSKKGPGGRPKGPSRAVAEVESRVDRLADKISALKNDTSSLLDAVMKMPASLIAPRKAVAVFRGMSAKSQNRQNRPYSVPASAQGLAIWQAPGSASAHG